jgi:hypothetical protein
MLIIAGKFPKLCERMRIHQINWQFIDIGKTKGYNIAPKSRITLHCQCAYYGLQKRGWQGELVAHLALTAP